MLLTADRNGKIQRECSMQDQFLKQLYSHALGRMLLRPLVSPVVSKLGGRLLDTRASTLFIGPFIKKNAVPMEEYEPREYTSYNDFFKRNLRPGAREIDFTPSALISPCDGRLSVYRISRGTAFTIKHTRYTVRSLLQNPSLAKRYAEGYAFLFRLRVDDCHRYIFVDDGAVSKNVRIPGFLHTVNPVANDYFPIYKENAREYSLLRSDHFGTLLQMEVGALFVGKIENRKGLRRVRRGEEKGNFAFGGSTILLLTQKGAVRPDSDLLRNTLRGIETKVRLGEKIGEKE